MQQRLLALRRTEQAPGAAKVLLPFLPGDVRTAHRAGIRHREHACALRTAVGQHGDDLRNHVAGTAHDHRVADHQPETADVVLVVQRRVADRDPADEDRRQACHRRDLSGPPDLHVDAGHLRQLLLRRVLVRHGPARLARDESQPALQFERIDLVDDAIDVERQSVAALRDAGVKRHQLVSATGHASLCGDRYSHVRQRVQHGTVSGRQCPPGHFAHPIGVEGQRPAGRHPGIELAQEAGGGIAWIHEHLVAGFTLPLVDQLEIAPAQEDLASHFENRRIDIAQAQRDRTNRARIGGDVLAHLAVAACGRPHQHSVFVTQIDSKSVELEFGAVFDRRIARRQAQFPTHPRIERTRAVGPGIGFGADRQHRDGMAHLRKVGSHRAADPLRRRVGHHQLRMRGFEFLQFPEQPVVLRVRNARGVENVVIVICAGDLVAQSARALTGGVMPCRRHRSEPDRLFAGHRSARRGGTNPVSVAPHPRVFLDGVEPAGTLGTRRNAGRLHLLVQARPAARRSRNAPRAGPACRCHRRHAHSGAWRAGRRP